MPTQPRKTDVTKPPKTGEKTTEQAKFINRIFGFSHATALGDAPKGDIRTYRRMRNTPTIALARAIANAPIRTAAWGLESKDGTPDNIVEFVKDVLEFVWPLLIVDMLRARDYGFQAFEKVWDMNGDGRWVYKKLKGLLPEITEVVLDKEGNYNFLGIKQEGMKGGVFLPIEKSLWYIYDGDIGNWYGRSWFENIRENAWWPWIETSQRFLRQYIKKVAGTIPMIHYPIGESENITGETKSNYQIATSILTHLGEGGGVAIPQELVPFADEFQRTGSKLKDLLAWQISFLETQGQHGSDFLSILKYYDALMMRGLLVPERVGTEGQHGTKAESGEHADIALTIADIEFQDIVRNINWYVVNPLLVYNFGAEFENSVWVKREGLDPDLKIFYRSIIEKVLTSATNIDLFQAWIDVNSMFDALGLPKVEETLEQEPIVDTEPLLPGEKEEDEILASLLKAAIKHG